MSTNTNTIKLNLNVIPDAKICTNECTFKHDNGNLEKLGADSIIFCVGCGRKCHMECHNTPIALINSFKMVPRNNRNMAYFGEMSYLRIVCDNCANMLMANVPTNTKPCFQFLFEQVANKVIERKLKSLEEELKAKEPIEPKQNGNNGTAKRKKPSDDTHYSDDSENEVSKKYIKTELKSMLQDLLDAQLVNFKDCVSKIGKDVKLNIVKTNDNLGAKITAVDKLVNACSMKLDGHNMTIDDGFQKGFNNLMENAHKWLSPCITPTPTRNTNGRPSLRKNLLQSKFKQRQMYDQTGMRQSGEEKDNSLNNTPRYYRASAKRGPTLPTEGGISQDNDVFGPAVKRRIDFTAVNNQGDRPRQAKSRFQHSNAIYLRYVNPQITAEKMMIIIKRNPLLNEAIVKDPNAVEINRLVKSSLTEDQIANFKSGVSYRIGCEDHLLATLMDKGNWATHWEIRQWDPTFKDQAKNKSPNIHQLIDLTGNEHQSHKNGTDTSASGSLDTPAMDHGEKHCEDMSKN